jgi:serine/threonine protein kinase
MINTKLFLNNKYFFDTCIGHGIYGNVWLAHDTENNIYAIKHQNIKNNELSKIAKCELNLLKLVQNNNNYVKFIDFIESNNNLYLIMDYYKINLRKFIEINKFINLEQKLFLIKRWIYQLLQGIQYLNSLEYAHLDIKPDNLLIDNEFNIKICDMGLCCKPQDILPYQECQTSFYRSPEGIETHLYLDKSIIDFKADIWSIGCIIAEILLGFPLFNKNTSFKLKIQHKEGSIKRFNRKFLPFLLKEINDILKNINNSEKIFGINGSYIYLTDLLEKCLEHDKNKRITIDEALKHPFFMVT